jgi:hypothetical protein
MRCRKSAECLTAGQITKTRGAARAGATSGYRHSRGMKLGRKVESVPRPKGASGLLAFSPLKTDRSGLARASYATESALKIRAPKELRRSKYFDCGRPGRSLSGYLRSKHREWSASHRKCFTGGRKNEGKLYSGSNRGFQLGNVFKIYNPERNVYTVFTCEKR